MQMRRFRFWLAWLVTLLFISSLLTACGLMGEGDKEQDKQDKILYFFYPHDGSDMIKRLIIEYNSLNEGITVEGIEGPGLGAEFTDKLYELKETGETVPDVILIHDTWLARLASEECIRSLDGGLTSEKKEAFFKGMMDALIWEDEIYGLPFWQDMPLLYYRKDLIDSPPSDWSELAGMAEQAAKANDMDYGLIFPGKSRENAAVFLAGIWTYFNAYPEYEAEETLIDESAMMTAWRNLTGMVRNNVIPQLSMSMGAEDCRAVFEEGNAVFMWNWSYAARLFQNESSPLAGKVGISFLPVSENEENTGGILSGYALTMSRDTGLLPESWDFMQFLTGEEAQLNLQDAGLMPARKSLYRSTWLSWTGLPAQFPDMLQSGRALKPGTYAESTLNMMADALSLAIEEGKSAEDLILFVREGVVEEQQEEQPGQEAEGEGNEEETDNADVDE